MHVSHDERHERLPWDNSMCRLPNPQGAPVAAVSKALAQVRLPCIVQSYMPCSYFCLLVCKQCKKALSRPEVMEDLTEPLYLHLGKLMALIQIVVGRSASELATSTCTGISSIRTRSLLSMLDVCRCVAGNK